MAPATRGFARIPSLVMVLVAAVCPLLLDAQERGASSVPAADVAYHERTFWEPLQIHAELGGRVGPGAVAVVQIPPRTYGRARAGFGAGVTATAILATAALATGDGNACKGSGDYLGICRALFLGSTAAGGALGAVVGAVMRRDAPSGPAMTVLLGSAVGVMGAFILSVPLCEQEDPTNPAVVCGAGGMTSPGITLAAAGFGGLVGYLIGRRELSALQISGIGFVPAPNGATAFGVTLARSTH